MRAVSRLALCIALALTTCNPSDDAPPDDDTAGDEVAMRELPLPALEHLGDIAPGDYLFPRAALGSSGEGAMEAELVRVEPDAFVVSIEGGPHRRVPRAEAWPMACMAAPLEHAEGAFTMRMREGAPVFVLASSREAARVSVGLSTAQSRVVRRDAISLEGCVDEEPEGEASVARTEEGDAACLFADQETLDPGAGLPIPAGAPVRVVEEDEDWARVEVGANGGSLRGWMSASLVAREPPSRADWIGAALGSGTCVFPGRVDPRTTTDIGGEPDDLTAPPIPEIEIERVFRNGASQLWACYDARRSEVPDLTVTMEVLLLVDVDGHVSDASVTRGASADAALTRCVLERVRRFRFPPPRTATMNVRRTFQFHPPAAASEPE